MQITIADSIWHGNTGDTGGGLAMTGAADWNATALPTDPPAYLAVIASTFTKNNATSGAGLYLQYPMQVSKTLGTALDADVSRQ